MRHGWSGNGKDFYRLKVMVKYQLIALTVPILWALSTIVGADVVKKYGTLSFNIVRNTVLFIVIAVSSYFYADYSNISLNAFIAFFVSGVAGLFLGDVFLFYGVSKIGPRRATMLFSTHVIATTIFAWFFLGEVLSIYNILGVVLVTSGVIISVRFSKKAPLAHRWEVVPDKAWLPIISVLLSSVFQAIGLLIARVYIVQEVDPLSALTIRIGAATICLYFFFLIPNQRISFKMSFKDSSHIIISGIMAIILGNYFLLVALAHLNSGIIATYVSLVPVFQLPIIWISTGQAPSNFAWLGAVVASIGTYVLLSS